MPKIEVEHRGLLSKEKFEELKSFFSKKGKFSGEKKRFTLLYSTKHISKVKYWKDDPIDLKLRITNKKAELIMKYGRFSGKDSRKEFVFEIDSDKFDEMVEFLKILGFNKGKLHDTHSYIYMYKGVEFALVEIPKWGYYFEAEILTSKKKIDEASQKIENLCRELRIEAMGQNKFYEVIDELNNREGYRFDLRKQKFSEIQERFKEYF
ncbi:hypothetical protein COY23_00125 [bacterium (Candidatus Torokbacteria) CG_4_10_14_0_2_um_filter_35_8]|uniref:CYTH domain-containing protein n=1 Tax=Candidatus Sherwoodlollariibacterium unditelluris TaxID=1974757 RepID=A0A2G9YIM4_9BACT|nr:MAG: hypothetical protein COX41_04585 [Candidatus Omnitrophica bacterium CG23_combo_of_CG06-09_8_20_14_all_41_10]PIZ58899.1 MAG: hypothetical protein COY23_00125 [bacterium (Candidatus Torokbacteria) CG_4_10_14_0_2_um_filter_35_8]